MHFYDCWCLVTPPKTSLQLGRFMQNAYIYGGMYIGAWFRNAMEMLVPPNAEGKWTAFLVDFYSCCHWSLSTVLSVVLVFLHGCRLWEQISQVVLLLLACSHSFLVIESIDESITIRFAIITGSTNVEDGCKELDAFML